MVEMTLYDEKMFSVVCVVVVSVFASVPAGLKLVMMTMTTKSMHNDVHYLQCILLEVMPWRVVEIT